MTNEHSASDSSFGKALSMQDSSLNNSLAKRRERIARPISMQDIRLIAGEGKLPQWVLIEAFNVILKQRADAILSSDLVGADQQRACIEGSQTPESVPLSQASCIRLRDTEIQSGLDRVRWAEGLIRQLPETHNGRNSWLLNYEGNKHANDKFTPPSFEQELAPPIEPTLTITVRRNKISERAFGIWILLTTTFYWRAP